jgi:hypothetical protein
MTTKRTSLCPTLLLNIRLTLTSHSFYFIFILTIHTNFSNFLLENKICLLNSICLGPKLCGLPITSVDCPTSTSAMAIPVVAHDQKFGENAFLSLTSHSQCLDSSFYTFKLSQLWFLLSVYWYSTYTLYSHIVWCS